ncbi:uncharacterized protein LOC143534534 [Bidens hawaiensis]|uniref:uncharacterized protein LOC143534534 n=1 Tax=Bidens hawaiensis TaxID=980011 RepID=UPI00404AC4FB
MGKLLTAPGGKVFMLAMTGYFSKWTEAEAFAQVREQEVISFIKGNILTHFGIPADIIYDNWSQFIGKKTTNFYVAWGIKMIISMPKKLGTKKGKWAEELPSVLWVNRTTSKNATGQTHFSLVFGTKAMIPTEIMIPTARSCLQNPETNNQDLPDNLDMVDVLRDSTKIRIAAFNQRITNSYNKNIRVRSFQVGDLVLRKAFQNTTDPKDRKLAPKWEGPYKIEAEFLKRSISAIYYRW